MIDQAYNFLAAHQEFIIRSVALLITVIGTLVSLRLLGRYIRQNDNNRHFDDRRANAISKLGQGVIIGLAVAIASNILGFGVQGIFIATSSLFALVGIAFFAVWSILSNTTASVLIYFSFPFRIGDRISIEGNPEFSGILRDITLFYLKIESDKGSIITVPSNVAVQKIVVSERGPGRRPVVEMPEPPRLEGDKT